MDGISFVHRHLNALQKMMELTLDDWDTATRKMLAIIADVLDVKYVGFCRNYNNDCDELNWVIYTRDEDSYSDMTMQVSELKKYTSYLSEELLLAVDDVFNDERVREYNKIYHIPYGITSSMEIPMRVNGKVSGIMCMEHVGPPRKWTEGEQSFALLAERIMAISVESDERAKAEAALVSSREKYMRVFNGLAYPIFLTYGEDGQIYDCNDAACFEFGYSKEFLINRSIFDFSAEPEQSRYCYKNKLKHVPVRYFRRSDGTQFPIDITGSFVKIDGLDIGITLMRDITDKIKEDKEREVLEKSLEQSRRLESLGVLAGGIAHDFNNILNIILGHAELGMRKLDMDRSPYDNLQEIVDASMRARDMVNQIVSFSMSGAWDRQAIRVRPVIREVVKLLTPSLPDNISIRIDIRTHHDVVLADPVQIYQVVMNLSTNAIYAMSEKGGILTIGLHSKHIGEKESMLQPERPEGEYLRISLEDTGCGISSEIIDRLFDPYFTTKNPAHGTGMGLSVVHGIVRSLKGWVYAVNNEPQGAIFNVYLPLTHEKPPEK